MDNLTDTAVYSRLTMVFSMIVALYGIYLILRGEDIRHLIASSLAPFIIDSFPREIIPLVSIMLWKLSGIASFILLQAFPYEIAEKITTPKKSFHHHFSFVERYLK